MQPPRGAPRGELAEKLLLHCSLPRGKMTNGGEISYLFFDSLYDLPRRQIKILMFPGRKGDSRGVDIKGGGKLRRLR